MSVKGLAEVASILLERERCFENIESGKEHLLMKVRILSEDFRFYVRESVHINDNSVVIRIDNFVTEFHIPYYDSNPAERVEATIRGFVSHYLTKAKFEIEVKQ